MKTFVEIGTCDFDTLRPLCESGWKGYMVEPYQPFLDNIEDHDNLTKINNAVGLFDGEVTYRKVKDEVIEQWDDDTYKGMGTVTTITRFDTDDAYKDVVEEHVAQQITFDTLMTTLNINEITYLKIDTEGMDFDIIKSIDYDKYEINFIKMEHSYCDEKLVIDFLENKGYHCELFIDDIIAIKK